MQGFVLYRYDEFILIKMFKTFFTMLFKCKFICQNF